jgi:hypothetical protein
MPKDATAEHGSAEIAIFEAGAVSAIVVDGLITNVKSTGIDGPERKRGASRHLDPLGA